jgi:hypothetical protein
VARVFLTGTGNDAGDCTNQATPCRSLQGAVNQCPVDGEIIILDNGGYGGATIAKSLTVNASAGIVAFIARTVTVNIASTDKVVLRGLSMNGVVFGDPNGILFSGGGTLVVENSVIAGFTTAFATSIGINQTAAGSNLIVNNCELRNNDIGVVNGTGSTTNSNTVIENSRFEYNAADAVVVGAGTASVSVRNSVFANNFEGINAFSSLQSKPVLVVVDTCTIAHNSFGLTAATGSAIIRVTNSTIDHNSNGMFINGGTIESYGNNRVLANANGSTFSGTVALQ